MDSELPTSPPGARDGRAGRRGLLSSAIVGVLEPGRSAHDRRTGLLTAADRALCCALQPIVDLHSGVVHGVEALMRGFERLGDETPHEVLDRFARDGAIVDLEVLLHRKAVEAFVTCPVGARAGDARLFLNLDNRALMEPRAEVLERTLGLLTDRGLPHSTLCVEISERHERFSMPHIHDDIHNLRARGVRFAADDFGQGHSELKLLFDQSIDYVKIDKYFIQDIADNDRAKMFLQGICRIAHVLGVRVIAEGVETARDLVACRDMGCDFGQGWFIARPQSDPRDVSSTYRHFIKRDLDEKAQNDREARGANAISAAMTKIVTVQDTASIEELFEIFSLSYEMDMCVVVDAGGEPRGTISQSALRPVAFSRYGRDLIRNGAGENILARFISPCPCVDERWTVPEALDLFVAHPGARGLIVTSSGRYVGFLTAEAMVTMANERFLTDALDRNPLTRLPGNTIVAARIAAIIDEGRPARGARYVCYFDFDHFKPFNDYKGFRQGDRAIVLFAEAMLRHFPDGPGSFFGHLGGDDFVGVFEGQDPQGLRTALLEALSEFSQTVAGLYAEEERAKGSIEGVDRFGVRRRFPLLRCSLAVVELRPESLPISPIALDETISRLKTASKHSATGLAWERLSAADGPKP